MNTELIQIVINLIFSKYIGFLIPFLFLLMVLLFADRLIDTFYSALSVYKNRKHY